MAAKNPFFLADRETLLAVMEAEALVDLKRISRETHYSRMVISL